MDLFGKFITIIGALVFLVFVSFLLSWPVYMLWNGCLLTAVDGTHEITWMQAWGLNLLFGMLFSKSSSK